MLQYPWWRSCIIAYCLCITVCVMLGHSYIWAKNKKQRMTWRRGWRVRLNPWHNHNSNPPRQMSLFPDQHQNKTLPSHEMDRALCAWFQSRQPSGWWWPEGTSSFRWPSRSLARFRCSCTWGHAFDRWKTFREMPPSLIKGDVAVSSKKKTQLSFNIFNINLPFHSQINLLSHKIHTL